MPRPERRRCGASGSSCRRSSSRARSDRAGASPNLRAETEAHASRSPNGRRAIRLGGGSQGPLPAAPWFGSTPRVNRTPIIIRAAVGSARRSRAPTCAKPTLGPPATMLRRARPNSRSRCSRRFNGRAERTLRGHPVLFTWPYADCTVNAAKNWLFSARAWTRLRAPRAGSAPIFRRERSKDANPGRARSRPIG